MQFEHTPFSTSWIPTTTIPVTRTTEAGSAADNGYSWTWTAHTPLDASLDDASPPAAPTDSQGTLTFTVDWGCDESDIAAGNYGLISVSDTATSIAYFSATEFVTTDGTNTSTYAHTAFSAGDSIDYVVRWGDFDGLENKLSVGFSTDSGATWVFDATPGTYDGGFTLGSDLRLGYGNLYPFHIKDIKFYDVAFNEAQVEAGLDRNILLWWPIFELP